jgi:hypothetical protein
MTRGPAVKAEGRHPATQQLAQWFTFDHLREDLRPPSAACAELAQEMINKVGDGPELSAGLRKLLEAKDCFVRAAIDSQEAAKEAIKHA